MVWMKQPYYDQREKKLLLKPTEQEIQDPGPDGHTGQHCPPLRFLFQEEKLTCFH